MTTLHPHSLVVPEQVVSAFQEEILPKPIQAVLAHPKNLRGKVKRVFQKSTLLTAPVLALGSAGLFVLGPQFLEFNIISVMAVIGGGTIGTALGTLGTVSAAISVREGDNRFAPLPPTQKYLELQEEKQKNFIQPFEDWDAVFSKHDNRTKLSQILNKKA